MHRAFVLKARNGRVLASGEEVTSALGETVNSRLTFHFRDGSLDDEDTVFTQGKSFRLVSDHHVQRGPSFPTPIDTTIDAPSGRVTWLVKKSGKNEYRSQHVDLPSDLANGIMPLLVENFPPGGSGMQVSWVAIAYRPLLVTLSVKPDGQQSVDPDGIVEQANEYTIHAELHGMVSFLAPLVNKQPADIHIWVTDEASPSFARLEGPFYQGAPDWTVEPAGPAIHQ